mmetsp:Transcript_1144/g.1741  ORF Transcript_1144/g.1741 Transcript_1144/m.1741 type:complete len:232 (-) Transcript_1144:144-839(-)
MLTRFALAAVALTFFCCFLVSVNGAACNTSRADVQGPYYRSGAPFRTAIRKIASYNATIFAAPSVAGQRIILRGTVYDSRSCRSLVPSFPAGSKLYIDIWQADSTGAYSNAFTHRGKVAIPLSGQFAIEMIQPGRYMDGPAGYRPAHVHFKVSVQSPSGTVRELLTSQYYFKGDPYLGKDCYCCDSSDLKRVVTLAGLSAPWNRYKTGILSTLYINPSLPAPRPQRVSCIV